MGFGAALNHGARATGDLGAIALTCENDAEARIGKAGVSAPAGEATVERRRTPVSVASIEPRLCTLQMRLRILRRTPFLAALAPEELLRINRLFVERSYSADQAIYVAGEPATRLYIVASGQVKLARVMPSGQSVLLDLLTPGDFFGNLSATRDRTYRDSAQAHTMCCVLSIAADEFQAILRRYPPVALAVLDVVTMQLQATRDLIEHHSAQPVERRLAATLLTLGEKVGEERDGVLLIQMPLSRQDLAAMAGTTIETASRVMSQFRKDGLIHSGRRWVALAARDRLAVLAGRETL